MQCCCSCNRHTRASCGWCFHWGCVRGTRDIGVRGQRGDTCDRCDARDVLLSRSLGAMKHTLRAEEKRVQAWLVRRHLALQSQGALRAADSKEAVYLRLRESLRFLSSVMPKTSAGS